jgi:gamma-D-glutamyl-L-lysine dipeptidyl-peptidase
LCLFRRGNSGQHFRALNYPFLGQNIRNTNSINTGWINRTAMNKFIWIACLLGFLSACRTQKESVQLSEVSQAINQVRQTHAPDKRVAIFNVKESGKSPVVLTGETSLPEAKSELLTKLQAQGVRVIDSIQVLPAAILGNKTYGVVTISVANIRSQPDHSAELATQATLGTPVKVLNQQSNWYQVQTPDEYISWVDAGGIQLMTEEQFGRWQQSTKLIYTTPFGFSYSEPAAGVQPVSDLVMGNILELTGEKDTYYTVRYPDGRAGYIAKNEAVPYKQWLASLQTSEESLIRTAKQFMGIPYLWGGTSPKGMDCSGFTKTVYFLNGMVLPRDASQQVHSGDLIDTSAGYTQLKPGDLLFFGTPATDAKKEKVVHVGMWLGNNQFIHASGKITIASFDKNAPNFDAYNFSRFLRAKRILNATNGDVLKLQSAKIY